MVLSDMAKTSKVTVGLVQMSCGGDPAANLTKALGRIADAAKQGAQIVCLQELFKSVYFCQEENADLFELAEPIPGPTTEALCASAKEHRVVVVGSIFEKRAAGLYHNSSVVIDADGALLGVYRKMHIPDDPLFYEKFYAYISTKNPLSKDDVIKLDPDIRREIAGRHLEFLRVETDVLDFCPKYCGIAT